MTFRTLTQLVPLLLAASATLAQAPAPPAAVPSQAPTPAKPKTHLKKPDAPSTNFNLIVLDPGHGGSDKGASFPNNVPESDVTLALANKLRSMLAAQGFTVVLTRENSTDDVPQDTRIELANRSHALACLLLHAANGGRGVHLYTSSLTPVTAAQQTAEGAILPWDSAQAATLPQSTRLLTDLQSSLNGIRVSLVAGRASVAPIDSLTCPAVALEIAPLAPNGDVTTPVDDSSYQQHVAEAVTTALVFWRGHAQAASAQAAAVAAQQAAVANHKDETAKPKPKPKPRPVLVPDDGSVPPPAPAVRRPAPVVRAPAQDKPPPSSNGGPAH